MSERYIVTGCAGFIGAEVCQQLLAAGHQVVGLDSLNDAYDPQLKHWRLSQLDPHANFKFHAVDITDLPAIRRACAATPGKYQGLIHLAARAGVRASVRDPWTYYETNVRGTLNLFELCRDARIHKVVLASTSSLYGSANPVPYREDMPTDGPLSPYAATKKAAEALAYTYHHLHGFDLSVLRFFTVYGPGGRPDMSIFRFVRALALGQTMTVFGDGHQRRDFTFVSDIARGAIAALRPVGYQVINLGGHQSVPLLEVIDKLAKLLGTQPKIRFAPAHPADAEVTWADVTKARQLLDWQPQVDIDAGLAASVQWYENHRELANRIDTGEGRPAQAA